MHFNFLLPVAARCRSVLRDREELTSADICVYYYINFLKMHKMRAREAKKKKQV